MKPGFKINLRFIKKERYTKKQNTGNQVSKGKNPLSLNVLFSFDQTFLLLNKTGYQNFVILKNTAAIN
ncbi:MAG: hypothetical protein CM1200mP28_08560 [Deltaproteobacteria bacterium]|nr:MAG: hypothetical protein CM1200mP28_08560 [Deltaproteobacteria bacterium]